MEDIKKIKLMIKFLDIIFEESNIRIKGIGRIEGKIGIDLLFHYAAFNHTLFFSESEFNKMKLMFDAPTEVLRNIVVSYVHKNFLGDYRVDFFEPTL